MSAVEHSAVLEGARWAAAEGEVVTVGVDPHGRVDTDDVASALPGASLCSLQHGNPEVGTLQPVAAVAAACAEAQVPLHVDAAASVGRLPVPGGWSLLTASAHKWGGPPGVGVLVVRRGTRWRTPLPADEREGGRVPGAVNLPAVVAAAAALEQVSRDMAAESARLSLLVERIRTAVAARVPDAVVVGHPTERLPHVVAFSCLYVDGESLVLALDRAGFAVHSGSACTASALRPSHVLAAMGALTHGNVRVSLPRGTQAADVEAFLDALVDVVAEQRAEAGTAGL